MKKCVLCVIVLFMVLGVKVYGQAKYEEVKPVLERMATSLEKFIGDLEKVENADAVVAAFASYTDTMEKLVPDIKAIIKKYPELKDEKNHPEELKPLTGKIEELSKKMIGVMGKIQPYATDPKVVAASQRFMEVMGKLDEGEPKDPNIEKKE